MLASIVDGLIALSYDRTNDSSINHRDESRRVASERYSLLSRLADAIFGFDFFISYSWSDGLYYANQLADRLREQGFKSFLDRRDLAPGDNWRRVTRIALRHTSFLLVICSPEVLKSQSVVDEVTIFRSTRRKIVPIDFESTLRQAPCSSDLRQLIEKDSLLIDEDMGALSSGPTESVIRQVRSGFDRTRQAQKRQRWLGLTTIAFLVLAFVAGVAFVLADTQRRAALSRGLAAQAVVESRQQIDLALLLAAEANRIKPTTSSRSALLHALTSAPIEYYLYGDSAVGAIAIKPGDPNFLVSADWSGILTAWNLVTGEIIASVSATDNADERIDTLAFSPNGTQLVSDGASDTLVVWNTAPALEIERVLRFGSDLQVRDAVYLDDRRVLVVTDKIPLMIVNLYTTERKALNSVHDTSPTVLAVDHARSTLATGGYDRVVIWDIVPSGLEHRATYPVEDLVLALSFDRLSTLLAAGLHDNGVLLLDTETGDKHVLRQAITGGRVFAVTFPRAPDGDIFWSGDDEIGGFRFSDWSVQRWAVHRDATLDLVSEPHRGRLIAASRSGQIAVLDLTRTNVIAKTLLDFHFEPSRITDSIFLSDGRLILANESGSMYVIDSDNGGEYESLSAHVGAIRFLGRAEGLNTIVSAGADGWIRWWLLEGATLRQAHAFESPVALSMYAIDPELGHVIAMDDDGSLYRIARDETSLELLGKVPVTMSAPDVLMVHPWSSTVVLGMKSDLVAFDWIDGSIKWRAKLPDHLSAALMDVKSNRLIVCVGTSVEFRDVHNGEREVAIEVGRYPISMLRSGLDDRIMVAIDSANGLTFWDLNDLSQIGGRFNGDTNELIQAQFNGDRDELLTLERSYVDGTRRYRIRRWKMGHDTWEDLARRMANRSMTEVERRRFDVRRPE